MGGLLSNLSNLKRVAGRVLCSAPVGWIIRYFTKELSYYSEVRIPVTRKLTNQMVAAIYFGLYEKSEALLIQKHLPSGGTVIELGASLGVISCVIGKSAVPDKLVCIEALPELKLSIKELIKFNQIKDAHYLAVAYASNGSHVNFFEGKTTLTGIIARSGKQNTRKVSALSLRGIMQEADIFGPFNLVCDIEGAEVDLLLNESEMLTQCRYLIIEVHESCYNEVHYTIAEIVQLIEEAAFYQVDRRGNVFAFEKIPSTH